MRKPRLRQHIEQGFLAALDMPVTVILRTASELARLIADCRYVEERRGTR
ncbi:DUF1697 domain-containing protein [Paenibacillus thiaminolyticus]|nr:DUF1697 domain-containing protein [Paenibacillus thiaminolyticus]